MTKQTCTILMLLSFALILSQGCGGGGSSSSGGNPGGGNPGGQSKSVSGIYSGTTSDALGDSTSITDQVTQNGNSTTGVDLLDFGGEIVLGTSTGTVTGTGYSATVNYGKFGISTIKLTINGNSVSGTYSRTVNGAVVDTGSIQETLSAAASTGNAAGTYTGTSTRSGAAATPLAFTVTQNGNSITISNGLSNGNGFTGTGVIVGNTFGADLQQTGSTNKIDIIGTLSGNSISGSTWEPPTNSGNNGVAVTGTFNVSS